MVNGDRVTGDIGCSPDLSRQSRLLAGMRRAMTTLMHQGVAGSHGSSGTVRQTQG